METRSVFISSVTRRDLSRRRAAWPVAQVVLAAIVLAAALGVFLAVRGGL